MNFVECESRGGVRAREVDEDAFDDDASEEVVWFELGGMRDVQSSRVEYQEYQTYQTTFSAFWFHLHV